MTDITSFPIPTKTFDPSQFAGEDGREVELRTSATHVQWRYVGDVTWTDLILLSALEGPKGDPGLDGIQPSGSTIVNVRETVQDVSDGTIDAALGSIVNMTLSAAGTLVLNNFDSGMSLVVHILGGDVHGMDFTSSANVQWHGAEPTLLATHTVVLERNGTMVYGYDAGGVA